MRSKKRKEPEGHRTASKAERAASPATHPPEGANPDAAGRKLKLEVDKLEIERALLARQLKRAGRPTGWEVLKTLVPWISVLVGVLAFATGHVQSLRQERQTLLQEAVGHYLGKHPEVGAYLLRDLVAADVIPKAASIFRALTPKNPEVATYLIQGIETQPGEDEAVNVLNRRRNLSALAVLGEIEAATPDLLCEKYSGTRKILAAQLASYQRHPDDSVTQRLQRELDHTVEFLCSSRSLLDEKCERETWEGVEERHRRFLGKRQDCLPGPA